MKILEAIADSLSREYGITWTRGPFTVAHRDQYLITELSPWTMIGICLGDAEILTYLDHRPDLDKFKAENICIFKMREIRNIHSEPEFSRASRTLPLGNSLGRIYWSRFFELAHPHCLDDIIRLLVSNLDEFRP